MAERTRDLRRVEEGKPTGGSKVDILWTCCSVPLVAFLIAGLHALIVGQLKIGIRTVVRGWPARLVGIFLVLPLPLLVVGVIARPILHLKFNLPKESPGLRLAEITGFGTLISCPIIALVIAIVNSEKTIEGSRQGNRKEIGSDT